MDEIKPMKGKELSDFLTQAIADGRITTFKLLEEERRISRSTIKREIADGKYIAVRIKTQWLLIVA